MEYARSQRDVQAKQELYLTLLQQKELAQIEENKTSNVVQILDRAILQSKPAKPNKYLLLVLSFIIGIMVSFLWIIVEKIIKIIKNDIKIKMINLKKLT